MYLHKITLNECTGMCLVGPTRCKNDYIGIMFLSEVALGNEHNIKVDNCSLTCAPKGYDSIVARGHTEPGKHGNKFSWRCVSSSSAFEKFCVFIVL